MDEVPPITEHFHEPPRSPAWADLDPLTAWPWPGSNLAGAGPWPHYPSRRADDSCRTNKWLERHRSCQGETTPHQTAWSTVPANLEKAPLWEVTVHGQITSVHTDFCPITPGGFGSNQALHLLSLLGPLGSYLSSVICKPGCSFCSAWQKLTIIQD